MRRILLLFVLLTGCSLLPPRQTTIKVGLLVPLTGPAASFGIETKHIAEMSIAEWNATAETPIVLIVRDSVLEPRTAFREAIDLAVNEQIDVLIGPVFSNAALPVSNVMQELGVPMLTPTASNAEITRNKSFIFRMIAPDTLQGRVLAEVVRDELGASRSTALYPIRNLYAAGLTDVFSARFVELGGEVVATETYQRGQSKFTATLQRIVAAEPDVVLLPNGLIDAVPQAQTLRELGYDGLILGADSWGNVPEADYQALDNSYFSQLQLAEVTQPAAQAFQQAYEARYDEPLSAEWALTYDTFQMLFQALEMGRDRTTIRAALSQITTFEGASGSATFDANGDPLRPVNIYQISNGALTSVGAFTPADDE